MSRKLLAAAVALSFVIAGISIAPDPANASPPHPDYLEELRANGQLDEVVQHLNEARAKGVNQPSKYNLDLKNRVRDMMLDASSEVDTFRVLVILADFSDNAADDGQVYGQPADFEHLLFSFDSTDNHWSMSEFYLQNSYGKFFLQGTVVGWYRMPQTYAYYEAGETGFGPYPTNAQRLAEDAVIAADADVDYSNYDNDNDGYIDGVFVVHAGPGAEQGAANAIWSHKWSLRNSQFLDGVTISDYTMEPEELQGQGLTTMGVYGHEYGHFLGLPDLYDTDYSSEGIGDWSMMAGGSWNNNGRRPAFFDAWCKKELGFLQMINVTSNMQDVEIPSSYHEPVAYRLWMDGSLGQEYFLIENRRRTEMDGGIPASGLLIMHIDDSRSGNWDETHYLVAIEQADGDFDLENDVNQGDAQDVWSAYIDQDFDDLSTPNTRAYSGVKTRAAVWDISLPDSVMTASFDINYSRPLFQLMSGMFSDDTYGNGNGVVEVGEQIAFWFEVQNKWLEATNVTGTLTADNNDIVFDVPSVNIGTLAGEGGTGNNFTTPISFTIPADFSPCIDSFYLTIDSDIGLGEKTFGFSLTIGEPKVLVIDDDDGADWEEYVTDELYERRTPYAVWDKSVSGSPSVGDLSDYTTVIWLTGDERDSVLTGTDVATMQAFLDAGGNLFLTGQVIARELNANHQSFMQNYLHAAYDQDLLFPLQDGIPGSRIGDGLALRYGSQFNQTDPQTILPVNGGEAEFELNSVGGVTAVSYSGSYKVVFFSFGIESISNTDESGGYATQATVLGRIMEFFEDGPSSLNPVVNDLDISGESSLTHVLDLTPTFTWTVSDTTANPVVEYQVLVGTGNFCNNLDNYWESPVFSGTGGSVQYAGLPLQDGGEYVARVRVSNGVTWSEWAELSFRVNSEPVIRNLIEPARDTVVTTSQPELRLFNGFDADGDVLEHQFEVFSDESLTQLVAGGVGTIGETSTIWEVDVPLTENERFYWRVRLFDGYEYSDYSETQEFRVNAVNSAPGAFSLLEPVDEGSVSNLYPVFTWQPALEVDPDDSPTYTLQVSTDSTFAAVEETGGRVSPTASLPTPLVNGSTYFWRVLAEDLQMDSTWSTETFSFTVDLSGCCVGIRGNVNGDGDETVNIVDLTVLVAYLFTGGTAPSCMEEADVNGDASVNIVDLTYLTAYSFTGGPAPVACP